MNCNSKYHPSPAVVVFILVSVLFFGKRGTDSPDTRVGQCDVWRRA